MKRQSLEALGAVPVELTDRELNLDGTYADLMSMKSAGIVLRDIANEFVASFTEGMSQPATRAGFISSMLTSMLCARARLGFLPSVAIAVMVGVSVEHLYGMAEDIHETAVAQQDYLAALTARTIPGAPEPV